jgi:hypothetical protein
MVAKEPARKPRDPRYIPAPRFLVGLFFLGLLLYGAIEFWVFEEPFTKPNIQETIGGAIPFVLFPSLIVVPWRLIQRRSGRLTNTPIYTGGAFAILLAFVLITNVLRILRTGS